MNLNARNALRLGNNSTEPTEVFLPPKGIDRSLTAAGDVEDGELVTVGIGK